MDSTCIYKLYHLYLKSYSNYNFSHSAVWRLNREFTWHVTVMVQERSQIHPDSTCKQDYQLTQNQKNIDIIELKPRN